MILIIYRIEFTISQITFFVVYINVLLSEYVDFRYFWKCTGKWNHTQNKYYDYTFYVTYGSVKN